MSGVRAATVLALWGAAYRVGAASADAVLDQLASAGRSAGVRAADAASARLTSLPGPGEAGAGSVALLEMLRRCGPPRLVMPVAGDVRGLPPGSSALVPALDAGGAVVLSAAGVAVVPGDGHWRVFAVAVPAAEPVPVAATTSLFDAELELDAAIRTATARLTSLGIARGSSGVRDRIAAEMRDAAVAVPPGSSRSHRHGSALLAKVVSLEALLSVASTASTAAVTKHEIACVDDALRPLAAAVRAGRLAAVTELLDDLAAGAGRGAALHPMRVRADRRDGQSSWGFG